MTVQVTTSPPGATATHSDDTATGTPQEPAGPSILQVQEVLPEDRLEPVFEPAQLAFEPSEPDVFVAQLNGETDEQQTASPTPEESAAGDDSLESGLEPGAGGDPGGGAQSSGSSLAVAPFSDDGYGNRFGTSATGDIVLIGGPGFDLPGFDPNLLLTVGGLSTIPAASAPGPVFFIPAAGLNGSNGYIFKGIDPGDGSGFVVSSAGDVNGDGFDDLIIGAFQADPNGNRSGESYLVFGDQANLAILDAADGTVDGMIELSNLDGTRGYVLKGIDDGDDAGRSVASAGDVNGDGLDDLFIGAEGADQRTSNSGEGASYLVFGGAANLHALDGNGDGMIELSDLTAATGYVFKGIDGHDSAGNSVASAGDVNGDGFDDLIIGAEHAGDNGEGEQYLVFGGAANLQALDLADGTTDGMISLANLNGTGGYIFKGIGDSDNSGSSVASAGDVNGDGFDDLIIAAQDADSNVDYSGESYLVFGGAANLAALDLADGAADGMIKLANLNGTSGYVFKGIDDGDRSGNSVSSAGDVNGDGFDDLIIAAADADQSVGDNDEGESYLVFGGAANLQALDAIDGTDGMIALANLTAASGYLFKGSNVEDNAGNSVSFAGDVNGDGIDDLIIGADEAGSVADDEGEAYVVFGGAANLQALDAADGTTDGMIVLTNVGPGTGVVIRGIDPEDDFAGWVSAAGDVNGDGFDDLIIGAEDADPNGDASGESYLIYGGDFTGSVDILADGGSQTLSGNASANVINAGRGDDTVDGSGGGDVINTGEGDDVIVVPDLAFALIDGGRGKDTLKLDPTVAPLALDLSALPLAQQLQSLEVIDLTGGHSLTARKLNVIDILSSEGANVLKVLGDGTSMVTLPDGWGFHGTVPDPHGGPLTFQKFVHGSGPVTVLVQDGVPVDPTFQLATLDGGNGYIFKGIDPSDYSSVAVSSAGDVNGDGFDDLIIGAYNADPGTNGAGESYLVFGDQANLAILDLADGTADGMIELSNLTAATGFLFKGIDGGDYSGAEVSSAGDVNGDGFDDLIINATAADQDTGESYLVFGGANLAALDAIDGSDGMIALANLNGTTGFTFKGIDLFDRSGFALSSAGDVNGDGFDDLIIGALGGDQSGRQFDDEGESYLVFGGTANLQALDLADGISDGMVELARLDGTSGYVFKGIDPGDRSGYALSSAGDVNGDGFDDLIIGARGADQGASNSRVGESYLVFGGAANLAALDAIDGSDGMIALANLNGTNGFTFKGIDPFDRSGSSVSSAGDVNGDGFDDLIVGTLSGDQSGGQFDDEGESYLVFGGANLAALDAIDGSDGMIALANLNDTTGYTFKGIDSADFSGRTVSLAGDVNGDGFDDLIIGATGADRGAGNSGEGETYLVFGGAANLAALDVADGATDGMIALANVGPGTGIVIRGIDANDYSGRPVSSAGDVNGDGFDDLLVGAFGADPNGDYSGETYLIYGGDFTGSVEILADGGGQALEGDANANVINAGGGDDTVDGAGGADVINAGEGDDVIVVPDLAFALIDGGRGKDTLKLDPTVAPLDLDLSALPLAQQLQSLEAIDLTGGHSLTARKLNVIDILGSEGANVLKVLGDATSQVTLPDGWGFHGTVPDPHGGPLRFQKYVHGSGPVTVLVQDGVPVDPTFQLATLDGGNGYIFKGIDEGDLSGRAVSSAGDVNGDGFDDLIIGARDADQSGGQFDEEGESYLVFGGTANLAALDLADGAADGMIELANLTAATGYTFKGIDFSDLSGGSVSSAGDVNGDGFDDLIIGAYRADQSGGSSDDEGESYLVFGGAANLQALDGNGDGMIELSDLTAAVGYVFKGIDPQDKAGDSVSSAGDVNGDGFDDLLIGARGADPGTYGGGETYLVFGGAAKLAALDGNGDGMIELSDMTAATGFLFKGIDTRDASGSSVSSAGDVNGDGFDDLIIGAPLADRGVGASQEGESYLVFGGDANLAALDASDGTTDGMIALSKLGSFNGSTGYLFKGIDRYDLSSESVSSAGDVNGDGFDDLIIGADGGDQSPGNSREGESYLVFGGQANLAALDAADSTTDGMIELAKLDGTTGYTFKGIDPGDYSGFSVSSAGDVNGDGFDDLIIGAVRADQGGGANNVGESYVVFGGAANLANLDVADGTLDGMIALANVGPGSGLVVRGIDANDFSGYSVSAAGDVNGDGFDDLIVGASGADPNGNGSGESYLIYGGDFTGSVEILADGGGQALAGDANANVINAGNGDDTVVGNGGADVLNGGAGDDRLEVADDNFFRVDGGGGEDVLAFALAAARDFGSFDRTAIQGVEGLDFTNGGIDMVTLGLDDVLALAVRNSDFQGEAGLDNVLSITGETDDEVHLAAADGWTNAGAGPGAASVFTLFTVDAITLAIDNDIDVVIA